MNDRMNRRTKCLTVSAMLCALGVILMALGSLIDVLDLSTAALASLLCVYAVIEMGGFYPWLIWLATSVLSLLLLPQKSPAVFYALLLGFYPMVKEKLEKLRRIWQLPLKLVFFHISLLILYPVLRFLLPSDDLIGWSWMLLALYLAALLCFLVYDFALTRLISFYLCRLRRHFRLR